MLALEKEFLIESQLSDGSWGSGDPLVCARILYALREGIPENTLIRGLKYLEGCQEPDGRFAQKTKMYSDASNTAYTLVVLNKFDYGKASLPVSRGIMWLLENQNEDGSWGPNIHKKAYTTTLCLRALYTYYLSGINRFSKGLDFSLKYLETKSFADEPISHIYAPILNLKRIGYLEAGLKEKFIDYAWTAVRDAIADGSVDDAAFMLGTLKALGEEDISSIIEEWLAAARNDDGSYGKVPLSPGDPGTTALAILALTDKL